MVEFKVTEEEHRLINLIVAKADALDLEDRSQLDLIMDLEATHSNGCPLDFCRLLNFPVFDFTHDICGIRRHLNRTTGQLEDHFLPRCSKPATN